MCTLCFKCSVHTKLILCTFTLTVLHKASVHVTLNRVSIHPTVFIALYSLMYKPSKVKSIRYTIISILIQTLLKANGYIKLYGPCTVPALSFSSMEAFTIVFS